MPYSSMRFYRYKSFVLSSGRINGLRSISYIDDVPSSLVGSISRMLSTSNNDYLVEPLAKIPG